MKTLKRAVALLIADRSTTAAEEPVGPMNPARGVVCYSDHVLIQLLEPSGAMGYYYLEEETVFTDGLVLEALDGQEVCLHLNDDTGVVTTVSTSLHPVVDVCPDAELEASVEEALDPVAVDDATDETDEADEPVVVEYTGKHALRVPHVVVSATHTPPAPRHAAVVVDADERAEDDTSENSDESVSA